MLKIYKLFLLTLIAGALLISCSDDNSITNNSSFDSNKLKSGAWRITYYWDTDHDETSRFSGHTFTFSDNGALLVSTNSNSYSGTWSIGTDDSQQKLYLGFISPSYLEEISDDWHIIEQTDVKIRLQDVSGGNGGTDYLTFERN